MKKDIKYDLAAYRNLPYETRREYQQSVDLVNIERALTQLFADLADLEVDREIFRRDIPPNLENGYGVRIEDSRPGEQTDIYRCTAIVWGRHTEHDEFRRRIWQMGNSLPLLNEYIAGGNITPVIFSAVYLSDDIQFALKYDNAQVKTEGIFIVHAWILTVPDSLLSGV